MLFKLISDGRHTWVELDGKNLGNAVNGVSFQTKVDSNGKANTTASIDIDLTERTYETHAFEDVNPGDFTDIVRRWERSENECKVMKKAADTVKWQLSRVFDNAVDGAVTPESIMNDLAERTARIDQQEGK